MRGEGARSGMAGYMRVMVDGRQVWRREGVTRNPAAAVAAAAAAASLDSVSPSEEHSDNSEYLDNSNLSDDSDARFKAFSFYFIISLYYRS